jgi:hypothetical protein
MFVFPRKLFLFFYFPDQATWLPLARYALFCRVAGTILGTVVKPDVLSIETPRTPGFQAWMGTETAPAHDP